MQIVYVVMLHVAYESSYVMGIYTNVVKATDRQKALEEEASSTHSIHIEQIPLDQDGEW